MDFRGEREGLLYSSIAFIFYQKIWINEKIDILLQWRFNQALCKNIVIWIGLAEKTADGGRKSHYFYFLENIRNGHTEPATRWQGELMVRVRFSFSSARINISKNEKTT